MSLKKKGTKGTKTTRKTPRQKNLREPSRIYAGKLHIAYWDGKKPVRKMSRPSVKVKFIKGRRYESRPQKDLKRYKHDASRLAETKRKQGYLVRITLEKKAIGPNVMGGKSLDGFRVWISDKSWELEK